MAVVLDDLYNKNVKVRDLFNKIIEKNKKDENRHRFVLYNSHSKVRQQFLEHLENISHPYKIRGGRTTKKPIGYWNFPLIWKSAKYLPGDPQYKTTKSWYIIEKSDFIWKTDLDPLNIFPLNIQEFLPSDIKNIILNYYALYYKGITRIEDIVMTCLEHFVSNFCRHPNSRFVSF